MITGYGIKNSLADLISSFSQVPTAQAPSVCHALYEYLIELLDERVLDGREYSALSKHLHGAFFDLSSLNELPPEITNGGLLHIADAVELIDRIKAVTNPEQEIECECDIGVFIDRIHRESKLGLIEEIELDFFRHWMRRALFDRHAH